MKLTTLLQSSDDLAYTQQWQRQEFEAARESESNRLSQVTSSSCHLNIINIHYSTTGGARSRDSDEISR